MTIHPREQKAILLLGCAFIFGVYMKMVHQPVSAKIESYKSQIQRSQAQMRDLESKQPQDNEVSEKIQKLENEEKALTVELSEYEDQVPSRLYTSQLVGEFTRLAKEVKLESVKQRVVREQTYSRIFLEVKFYSSFKDALNYVSAVESISPFLKVEEFEMLEAVGKTIELGGAPVKLVVSCLLSDAEKSSSLKAPEAKEVTVKRDILSSSSKPAEVLSDEKFMLEGITFDKKNPTAIINGDVFAINSELGGYKVKNILADTVILTDGVEDHILSLKAAEAVKK